MLKRIPFLAILIVLASAIVSPASGEDTTRIATLEISVWPEYDQPGVLVQYQGQIASADQSGATREISFLVPKGAGVGATCGIKSDSSHTSETWKESDAGDGFTTVTYKLSEPQFHVEFYYNPLAGATDKTMDFTYKAASPVDDLYLDIQHPLKATNFVLTPETKDSHTDKDGFTYHVYNQKQVAAGQTVSSKISYTKTDPNPSVSGQKSTAATATNPETTSAINPNLVVVLAVLAAAAGLIAYFAFIRREQPQFAVIPLSESHGAQRISRGGFCTECGTAMEPEDRFCAKCGKERREIVKQSSSHVVG